MAFANAAVSRRSTTQPTSWVPFPWATELPFTWSTAQGVWIVGSGPYSSYFYIKVSRDSSGAKFLSIVEKDGQTCDTASTGFGKEESETRIRAEMKDIRNQRYSMMFRQYSPSQLPTSQTLQAIKGKVTVLTIRLANSRKDYNYPMSKVSDRTEYRCNPRK